MKPSKIDTMRAGKTWMLLPSFDAIMWKGKIYCRKQEKVDELNKSDKIDSIMKSHETIHLRQAFSMGDSWLKFYWNYIVEYIKNIPLILIDTKAPYYFIPVEIEAYVNANNFKYADKNESLYGWKEYKKLKLKDKKVLAKDFFSGPRNRYIPLIEEYMKKLQ